MKFARPQILVLTVTALAIAAIVVVPAAAQTPTTPVLVSSSSVSGATLGIPRWKGHQSPTNPDKFWLSYANGGAGTNMNFTTDGGATWSTNTITINNYMDFHLSLMGHGEDLHFAFPSATGAQYRRFAAPAQSIADAGPMITRPGSVAMHRPNIMVQDNGRVWYFSRRGGSPSDNVLYRYSDNNGATWTDGVAFATNHGDIRIGSMPYVNGNPALVVLYLVDPRGYEYYLWNGTSFEARPDHSIWAANVGYDRSFTHNQINDNQFHLIFGDGTNLRHVWKDYNGGSGSWNNTIIMNEPYNGSIEWFPISTVHGDDLYVFYCRRVSGTDASKQVFYRKWTGTTQSWSTEYQISNTAYSGDPNTTFHVADESDYIPVFYISGSSIYFSKIPVTPGTGDVIPPARINDLGIAPGGSPGEIELDWTATGDDGLIGTATSYDIRYNTSSLNDLNWPSASPVAAPAPKPSGQAESHLISDLPTGDMLYFGLKAIDDGANQSELSNVAFLLVSDVEEPGGDPLLPDRTGLVSLTPNPFNSEARIEYEIAVTSAVELTVHNLVGQRVARLVSETKPAGRHTVFWNGTNEGGSTVATGVYLLSLVTEETNDTRKLVYLK